MADKRIPLVNDQFYHIYNRGVAKMPTFLNKRGYEQAVLDLSYYRFVEPPMKLSRFKELPHDRKTDILTSLHKNAKVHVKIVSFVLMPNHFHFLLQQTAHNGISTFISKFTNSYTRYLNTKEERVGPVFQGVFKAVRVETDEQLIHLSRYIHLNPVVSFVIKEEDLFTYPWSSLPNYITGDSSLVWSEPVLSQFSSINAYKDFLTNQISYSKELELIKHLTLEL